MYTQCPDCATVFRVGAETLRAAQGEVRCGVCASAFNALENLSEQPFRADPAAGMGIRPEDTITVEELPGSEDIELSSGDEAPQTDEPPPPEPAEVPQFAPAEPAEDDLDRTDENPVLVLDEKDEPEQPPREPDPPEAPRFFIPDEMRKGLAAEAARLASDAFDLEVGEQQGPSARRWPLGLGVATLLLLLVVQVVHSQRDVLLRQPGVGPLLAQAAALFGLPFAAPIDLAAFELHQFGATSATAGGGRLVFRASIVNRAEFAQPFPLLRLTLQDRYGTTLRMRDIEPADYLPGAGAPRLLQAGGRAEAEIQVLDPGRDAVGFEMDVCLKVAGGVRCASQPPVP